jgi:hypothetical protein
MIRCWGLTFWMALMPFAVIAADGDRTVVHTEMRRGIEASTGQTVDFGLGIDETVIAAAGSQRTGKAPRATIVAAPVDGRTGAYSLEIHGETGNVVNVTVAPNQPGHIELQRGSAGTLPYKIDVDTISGPNGLRREILFWQAEYRTEGTLQVGSCSLKIALWDMTADGDIHAPRFCARNGCWNRSERRWQIRRP